MRHLYDPANAQLGSKRLEAVLPANVRDRFREAVRLCCGDTIPSGVLRLAALMGEAMERLEAGNEPMANRKLFEFMVEKLENLDETG